MKGIIHPDDAEVAYRHGVDAIWISNHGGRQLDTSPATIWALPAIKERVSSNFYIKIQNFKKNSKEKLIFILMVEYGRVQIFLNV